MSISRGTLGVDRAAGVAGPRRSGLTFMLDADEPEDRRQSLLVTEGYCVVLQTLRAPPKLTASS